MINRLVFLKTEADFEQFRKSKQFASKNFRLRVRFNTNQNISRFGFIVPKKVMPKVVDRNRVKRRVKSLLQSRINELEHADLLFFPSKGAIKLQSKDFVAEITNLIASARLWKPSKK